MKLKIKLGAALASGFNEHIYVVFHVAFIVQNEYNDNNNEYLLLV